MNCEDVHQRMTDYLANELEDNVCTEFLEHVASCDACTRELDETSAVFTLAETAFRSAASAPNEQKLPHEKIEKIYAAAFHSIPKSSKQKDLSKLPSYQELAGERGMDSFSNAKRLVFHIAALIVICGIIAYLLIPTGMSLNLSTTEKMEDQKENTLKKSSADSSAISYGYELKQKIQRHEDTIEAKTALPSPPSSEKMISNEENLIVSAPVHREEQGVLQDLDRVENESPAFVLQENISAKPEINKELKDTAKRNRKPMNSLPMAATVAVPAHGLRNDVSPEKKRETSAETVAESQKVAPVDLSELNGIPFLSLGDGAQFSFRCVAVRSPLRNDRVLLFTAAAWNDSLKDFSFYALPERIAGMQTLLKNRHLEIIELPYPKEEGDSVFAVLTLRLSKDRELPPIRIRKREILSDLSQVPSFFRFAWIAVNAETLKQNDSECKKALQVLEDLKKEPLIPAVQLNSLIAFLQG